MKNTHNRKRAAKGLGRLYIRNGKGKEFKAGTPNVSGGYYYLEYQRPTGKLNGAGKPIKKKARKRLIDNNGNPINNLVDAEKARDQFMAPILAEDEVYLKRRATDELKTAEENLAQVQDEANPPLTIVDAWDEFEDHPKLDCGATLLYNYASHWNQFSEWLKRHDSDAVFMRDIKRKTALDYARHLNHRKVSPGTYNKHINFLKLIFNVLREEIRADASPFVELPTKKLSKAKSKAVARKRKRRELSTDELIKVIDRAEGDMQTLLMLGTYTGLRLGDCCTLRWNEVLLNQGIIKRVPNKSQGDEVKIGIPPRLISRLSETPVSKRKGYVLPKFAEDYTYVSDKGKHTHRTRITNRIQKHFELKCGISTHAEGTGYQYQPDPDNDGEVIKVHTGKRAVVEVGFHSLRHTFVSMQAEKGTSALLVQKIVGHGSLAMTEHYSHVSDDAARSATLMIGDGVYDADIDVLPDPLPRWAVERLRAINAENWAEIRDELLSYA
ncbi:tyrosine-type recombinase/integrase [Pontiellaceae bacterium B12227]|nr:tyrosine-type recombinase/integrase [Pontiellaceae bacterium B12227]